MKRKLFIAGVIMSLAASTLTASAAEDFVFGDVDADNGVSANDSALILQKALVSTYKLPIENLTDNWLKYADTNADGNLGADDAAFSLQKSLTSTFVLPAEKKYAEDTNSSDNKEDDSKDNNDDNKDNDNNKEETGTKSETSKILYDAVQKYVSDKYDQNHEIIPSPYFNDIIGEGYADADKYLNYYVNIQLNPYMPVVEYIEYYTKDNPDTIRYPETEEESAAIVKAAADRLLKEEQDTISVNIYNAAQHAVSDVYEQTRSFSPLTLNDLINGFIEIGMRFDPYLEEYPYTIYASDINTMIYIRPDIPVVEYIEFKSASDYETAVRYPKTDEEVNAIVQPKIDAFIKEEQDIIAVDIYNAAQKYVSDYYEQYRRIETPSVSDLTKGFTANDHTLFGPYLEMDPYFYNYPYNSALIEVCDYMPVVKKIEFVSTIISYGDIRYPKTDEEINAIVKAEEDKIIRTENEIYAVNIYNAAQKYAADKRNNEEHITGIRVDELINEGYLDKEYYLYNNCAVYLKDSTDSTYQDVEHIEFQSIVPRYGTVTYTPVNS